MYEIFYFRKLDSVINKNIQRSCQLYFKLKILSDVYEFLITKLEINYSRNSSAKVFVEFNKRLIPR